MKKCIECKNILPLDYFYKDSDKKDGKSNKCKPCRSHYRAYCKFGDYNVPKWANMTTMWAIYFEAFKKTIETGELHVVDHIIPREGTCVNVIVVCGLHCEDNLRVITAKENGAKGKTKWPDQPDYPPPKDRKARQKWRWDMCKI